MRKITKIIVHCSAGHQTDTAEKIKDFHLRPRSRGGLGWSAPGYHYIIEADGKVVATHPEELIANGVKGHNTESIHVCYVGGVDTTLPGFPPKDTRTPAQIRSLRRVVCDLLRRYPGATLHGHRDFASKACPSFDVHSQL